MIRYRLLLEDIILSIEPRNLHQLQLHKLRLRKKRVDISLANKLQESQLYQEDIFLPEIQRSSSKMKPVSVNSRKI